MGYGMTLAGLMGAAVSLGLTAMAGTVDAAVPNTQSLSASAKNTAVMRPRPWTVKAETTSCQLTQDFRQGDDAVTLSLYQSVVPTAAYWAVMGDMAAGSPEQLLVRVTKRSSQLITSDPSPQRGTIFRAKARWMDDAEMVQWFWTDAVLPSSLVDIDQLEIEAAHLPPFVLDARSLAQGSQELADCAARQRQALGWNDAVAVKPQPVTSPGSWATNEDYPAPAISAGEEGTSEFLLMISDKGIVTACHISASSGSQHLDRATCAVMMERAAFRPAKDAKGKPVSSQYFNRVRWAFPTSEAE
jgi:TonB family protein